MGSPCTDRETRREGILDAAEAVFLEHGYVGATLARVAKRSRKAIGSATYLVGKKPELAREVHRRLTDSLAEQLEDRAQGRSGGNLEAVVRRAIAIAVGWFETSTAELDLIASLECYPLAGNPVGDRLASKLGKALADEISRRRLLTAPRP